MSETFPEKVQALLAVMRNCGVDVECGACCEVGFTGVTLAAHTCAPKPVPPLKELEVVRAALDIFTAVAGMHAEQAHHLKRVLGAQAALTEIESFVKAPK